MSESWDEYAENWDSNPDVILFCKKAYDSLCNTLNIAGLNVLDFGCGTGLLTEKIASSANRILGLDPSEKMIEILKNKQIDNIDTLVTELSKETIASNRLLHSKFDLIVASSVCAFLPDYQGTLQLLKTILKPDGIFVQWDWLKENENSDVGFTENRIRTAFINSDLDVTLTKQAFSLESKKGTMPVIMGVAKNT